MAGQSIKAGAIHKVHLLLFYLHYLRLYIRVYPLHG